MKRTLIILTAAMFLTLTAEGQNLFFFGENSYPCTESFTLKGNNTSSDIKVVFAKDGEAVLLVMSFENQDYRRITISGKLIIYLDDGTVITLDDSNKYDYVDKISSTIYYLSSEQLSKLKKVNINTIRYPLTIWSGFDSAVDGAKSSSPSNSASNLSGSTVKGKPGKIDFPAVLISFFN